MKQSLGEENARLKTQLAEVLALHEDLRASQPDGMLAVLAGFMLMVVSSFASCKGCHCYSQRNGGCSHGR